MFPLFFLFLSLPAWGGNLLELQAILNSAPPISAGVEERYQRLVQEQTFADLLEVYDPKNQAHLKITYASFTPENTFGGGDDSGFGLHIVKRLELPTSNGKTRTIDVNELWAEDRQSGKLFLPDEIRIKSQAFEGERVVPGSHRLYLFDSIRVAWGGGPDEIQISRRSRLSSKAMRVPVSAPFSCLECHDSTASFAVPFLKNGEKLNHEAIVQNSHFTLPPEEMRGFTQYVDYLKKSGKSDSFIEQRKAKLKNIRSFSEVPGFLQIVERTKQANSFHWLPDDELIAGPEHLYTHRQGVYKTEDGLLWMDALEEIFEGKYRWWEPQVF